MHFNSGRQFTPIFFPCRKWLQRVRYLFSFNDPFSFFPPVCFSRCGRSYYRSFGHSLGSYLEHVSRAFYRVVSTFLSTFNSFVFCSGFIFHPAIKCKIPSKLAFTRLFFNGKAHSFFNLSPSSSCFQKVISCARCLNCMSQRYAIDRQCSLTSEPARHTLCFLV